MKIIHLSHSGFAVEDNNELLLFDPITPFKGLGNFKKTYIFSSHSHGDHFKPEIFRKYYGNSDFHFIFSYDILDKIKEDNIQNLHIIGPYDKKKIENINIAAYGSTDLGNSYLVEFNNKIYFHSGDLNWWHWKRMSKEEQAEEERIFKKEIEEIKSNAPQIDYAFVPVDPRLEEYGYLAINHFIKSINPKYALPMHSFGNYEYYHGLENKIDLRSTALVKVLGENKVVVR